MSWFRRRRRAEPASKRSVPLEERFSTPDEALGHLGRIVSEISAELISVRQKLETEKRERLTLAHELKLVSEGIDSRFQSIRGSMGGRARKSAAEQELLQWAEKMAPLFGTEEGRAQLISQLAGENGGNTEQEQQPAPMSDPNRMFGP